MFVTCCYCWCCIAVWWVRDGVWTSNEQIPRIWMSCHEGVGIDAFKDLFVPSSNPRWLTHVVPWQFWSSHATKEVYFHAIWEGAASLSDAVQRIRLNCWHLQAPTKLPWALIWLTTRYWWVLWGIKVLSFKFLGCLQILESVYSSPHVPTANQSIITSETPGLLILRLSTWVE